VPCTRTAKQQNRVCLGLVREQPPEQNRVLLGLSRSQTITDGARRAPEADGRARTRVPREARCPPPTDSFRRRRPRVGAASATAGPPRRRQRTAAPGARQRPDTPTSRRRGGGGRRPPHPAPRRRAGGPGAFGIVSFGSKAIEPSSGLLGSSRIALDEGSDHCCEQSSRVICGWGFRFRRIMATSAVLCLALSHSWPC